MLNESDCWVRLMAIESNDVVVLEHSEGLPELLLVDLGHARHSAFFAFLVQVVEQVAVLETLVVDFGCIFFL